MSVSDLDSLAGRPAVRRLGLTLLVLLSLAGYLVLAIWFPLRPYFNVLPSADLRSLAPTLADAAGYALLLAALFAFYWLAFRLVSRVPSTASPAAILLVAALFCAPLLFTFPFNATDVYRYFIRGRITAVHHQSPYQVAPDDLPADPYLPLAGEWRGESSPYGPLWEGAAALVVSASPDDLWAALLAFKGLAAAAHLLIAWLIWAALDGAEPGRRRGAALLWAWNPALLLIFVADAHNDAWMLAWLVAGYLLIGRGRPAAGMALAILGALTKPVALLALPFFFLESWRRLPAPAARLRFGAAALTFGLAAGALAFWPFGSPLQLAERLIREVGGGGGFSPLALIVLAGQAAGSDPQNGPFFSLPQLLFGLAFLWLLWLAWHGRSGVRGAADVFAAYIVQAFRFRLWYPAWPFPWLLLDYGRAPAGDGRASARLAAGLAFLAAAQYSAVIYGQVRTELFDGSQLAAHAIGVAFTFGLPLLIALRAAASGAR
jgi:hypothetical protein